MVIYKNRVRVLDFLRQNGFVRGEWTQELVCITQAGVRVTTANLDRESALYREWANIENILYEDIGAHENTSFDTRTVRRG